MGCISFIFAVLLVCSRQIQGSRAQTAVFVKTGEDLHLQLKEADVPERFFLLQWRFNESVNFVTFLPAGEPTVSDRYRGRVEVSVGNFSVKLKNLQKSDSGVYTARVTGDKDQQLSEYLVTVEDPVSPVKLTVDSVTNSSDSCDLTVTCRSLDSHQISINTTVTCDTTTCSQEGGERSKATSSGATLKVYLDNYKIICNYSNQVSRTNDSIMIDHFCPRHTGPETPRNHIVAQAVGGSVPVVALIIAAAVVVYKKKGKDYRVNTDNTVYAETERVQPVNQSPTNDASDRPPTSTYDLVGPHNGPIKSTKKRGNSLPESPYAEVETGQTLELSPTNGPSQSIYSMVGPHTGPSTSAETRGKPPESLYSSIDKSSSD